MNSIHENNKRIARNTIFLFVRSVFVLLLSLYTSRAVLKALGVVDYGIYNVVGGVVVMFSFLNNALTAAVQRYISFELGKGNDKRLSDVFCMSVNIHCILMFIIVFFSETIGLWFVYEYLNIPDERFYAALIVYQCAILSLAITILQVPYMSCVVAHEKFNVFAITSVIEAFLKMLIAVIIAHIAYDHLKIYSIFMFVLVLCIAIFYRLYTISHFQECKYRILWHKGLFKEMISYSTWSLWGGMATVVSLQGVNILLNVFFGPSVNAARGIAFQVKAALSQLCGSFMQSINPQIVKQYALGDVNYMHRLIFRSSRLGFLLLFLFALPILIETNMVLSIWLGQVPDHVVLFCRLTLISSLIDVLSSPFIPAVQATGKIKKYQSIVGALYLSNLPLCYLALKLTKMPEFCFYVAILISISVTMSRFVICRKLISFPLKEYVSNVLVRLTCVVAISLVCIIYSFVMDESVSRMLICFISCGVLTSINILFIGMEKNERQYIITFVKRKISNDKKAI